MSDWFGTARSNWVKVADLPGLGKSLDRFDGVRIAAQDGLCTIHFDEGDASPFRDPDEHEDPTELVPLAVAEDIMTYIEPGQVLILVESGAAVAVGAEVESDASGRAITKSAGVGAGVARDEATGAGQYIRVLR